MATIFDGLKKLFSTNVIVRNVGGKKLKVVDTDGLQASAMGHLKDKYTRLYSTQYLGHMNDSNMMAYQTVRLELFRDFDVMDRDPIIASALDIFADETCTASEYGEILTIQSPNEDVKGILYNLFYDILNIEFNLWSWTRNMCKYGDFYLVLDISPEYGIHNVRPVSTYDMKRVECSDPNNPNYTYFQQESMGKDGKYESYQVAHFRMLSDSNWLPYGRSMVEPARRVWKQLSLMEDAMLIHRVMRAPEKRIYKVDVGNIAPNEVDNYMSKLISKMKKTPYIDPQTGDYNLKFNLQNLTEDFFLPVRGSDSGTSIEPLSGMQWDGIEDVEYLRNKMLAALKVPKAFLNYDEGVSGKATLSMEDLRFARTITRIQKIIISELTKIAIVHLYAQGYRDEELINFSLELTNPSTVYEQEKIAMWSEKVNLSKDMVDNKLFSKKWIYSNVFNLSSDDIDVENDRIIAELKETYRMKQIEEEGKDPASKSASSEVDDQSSDSSGDSGGSMDEPSPDLPDVGGDTAELPPLEEKVDSEHTKEDFVKWGKEGGDIGGGRPKGSQNKYGTKKHVLGADPIGSKENKTSYRPDGSTRVRTFESMESQLSSLDKFIKNIDKKLLSETKKSL